MLGALEFAAEPGPTKSLIDQAWREMVASESAESVPEAGIVDLLRKTKDKFDELVANLVADSLTPSHAVRGTSLASPRLVVYETTEFSVSLSLSPIQKEGGLEILGHVMPKLADSIPPGGRAILRGASAPTVTPLSKHGEFRFAAAGGKKVRIDVEIGKYRIVVGPLPEAE